MFRILGVLLLLVSFASAYSTGLGKYDYILATHGVFGTLRAFASHWIISVSEDSTTMSSDGVLNIDAVDAINFGADSGAVITFTAPVVFDSSLSIGRSEGLTDTITVVIDMDSTTADLYFVNGLLVDVQ